ncbi:MAG: hypothetical protein ACO1N0_15220 [Fluviicola sp.]
MGNRKDRKRRREKHRIAKLKDAEPKPGRLERWKNNPLIYMITCSVVIAYPFFTIKYFESHTALELTAKYFLLPIFIVLVIVGPKFYMKHMRTGKKKLSKFGDFVSMTVLILLATGIFSWMSFSLIIITNKWFDNSEKVTIQERVILYYTDVTKNGRLRHYIQFTDPKTGENIDLEVYRKFEIGEIFEKEMNYGAWGILYSTK